MRNETGCSGRLVNPGDVGCRVVGGKVGVSVAGGLPVSGGGCGDDVLVVVSGVSGAAVGFCVASTGVSGVGVLAGGVVVTGPGAEVNAGTPSPGVTTGGCDSSCAGASVSVGSSFSSSFSSSSGASKVGSGVSGALVGGEKVGASVVVPSGASVPMGAAVSAGDTVGALVSSSSQTLRSKNCVA